MLITFINIVGITIDHSPFVFSSAVKAVSVLTKCGMTNSLMAMRAKLFRSIFPHQYDQYSNVQFLLRVHSSVTLYRNKSQSIETIRSNESLNLITRLKIGLTKSYLGNYLCLKTACLDALKCTLSLKQIKFVLSILKLYSILLQIRVSV